MSKQSNLGSSEVLIHFEVSDGLIDGQFETDLLILRL